MAIHTSFNDAEIQKYYSTPSYNQFSQKYYIRFLSETGIIKGDQELNTRWVPGLSSRPMLQTLASVKYYLSKNELNDFIRSTYKPLCISGNVTALQNRYFLPLGFTYDKSIPYSNFQKLNKLQKDVVLLKAFIAEDGETDLQDFDVFDTNNLKDGYTFNEYGEDVNRLRQETMILNEHNQNLIRGTIQVSDKKLLFFSIPYDKGWAIRIDGQKVESKIINIGFMGVIIPAGIHKVELSFAPPFFISGTLVMILSLILYVVLILRNKWKMGSTCKTIADRSSER